MLIEILILLFIIIIFYEIFNDSCTHYEGFASKKKNKKSGSSATPTITTVPPTSNVTTNTGENDVSTSPAPAPTPATSNDPMILSEKNAGQILLLKDQYNSQTKTMNNIKDYMTKLFDNVETLNDQVKALKSNK